jgi:hypothetical protein
MGTDPFFVLGCVRSGTTFLRNVLRNHPNLFAPEETHFYRWAEPFGSTAYMNQLRNNPVLKRHRSIDNVAEEDFTNILDGALNCRQLYFRYMAAFAKSNKWTGKRWFDKTPQNVYGVTKIIRDFPEVKFIHIIRDPFDVVASLKEGKVMKMPQTIGAAHYWLDAIASMNMVKRAYPKKVHELHYEDFGTDFDGAIKKICDFLDEDYQEAFFKEIKVTPKVHDISNILTPPEVEIVSKLCGRAASSLGYKPRGEQQIQSS